MKSDKPIFYGGGGGGVQQTLDLAQFSESALGLYDGKRLFLSIELFKTYQRVHILVLHTKIDI